MNAVKIALYVLVRISLVTLCVSTIYFEYMNHIINNERAETEKMILRSQLLQYTIGIHTNSLILGTYYKDNAPQEEIMMKIKQLHQLVKMAEEPDNEEPLK